MWKRYLGTCTYGTPVSYPEYLGEKYFYIQYNGKLYALDIQTGSVKWSANSELGYYRFFKEMEDKLVEITTGQGVIVVRDIQTGKVLKSVRNLVKKYVKKSNDEAVIFSESPYVKNGIIYVEVDGLTHHANGGASADHMIGYLKIDINNSKISFISDERNEIGIWK